MTSLNLSSTSSESTAPDSFGLYIHVPYCLKRCSYCDFFTLTLEDKRDDAFGKYLRALHQEIEALAPMWSGRKIQSIFLGGGTPSLLEPSELEQIFRLLMDHWRWVDGAEVTLEVNPETVTVDKLKAFHSVGVNRVSMGVQTLNPEGLHLLGRNHTVDGAKRCFDSFREAGFQSVSCDMIYGWPGQTLSGWRDELHELLTWGPDHLSLYELILEPGTPMTRKVRQGELVLPEEEVRLEMYRSARSIAAEHGLAWYEISNYARPGYEALHNVDNWKGSDYLGLGPGAHSFRAKPEWGARRANPRNMPMYLENPAGAEWKPRTWTEVCVEALLNGLRLREGWDPETIKMQYHIDLATLLQGARPSLLEAGYMLEGEPWQVTDRGAELLDSILGHFQNALPEEPLVLSEMPC